MQIYAKTHDKNNKYYYISRENTKLFFKAGKTRLRHFSHLSLQDNAEF